MIKKEEIQTDLRGRQITSTLELISFGHLHNDCIEEDKMSLVYKTHNNIVHEIYGELIEKLSLLKHDILSIPHGSALEVNDDLNEIISNMESLYISFGDRKEVF